MAASDATPVPKKNAAFRLYFAIRKNDGTLITTWAGADSEVSLDGAAFADCTSEATEIGTTGCGYIDFTAAEMNADAVMYKLTVTNTSSLPIVVTLFPEEAGDYRVANTQKVDVETIKTQAITAAAGITFPTSIASPTNITAGTLTTVTTATSVTTVNGLAANVITAASIAADAITDAKVASDVTIASVTGAVGSVAGNVGGNVTGSVGSVVGLTVSNLDATISSRMATYTQPAGFLAATFPSDPADQSLVIAATDAIIAAVGTRSTQTSVDDLPTNAELATALGTADDATLAAIAAEAVKTAAIKVATDRFLTMIIVDGAVYQYTANAVELGPGGSSTSITVVPLTGVVEGRVDGTSINVFTQETCTISIAVVDAEGNAVAVTGLTLEIVIESRLMADVVVIADGSITKSGSTISFAIPSSVSATEGAYQWALRKTTDDSVLLQGTLIVSYAPQGD